MKDPAFLFYPNDYLGGTLGMTFEEKGAYIELLMVQFNRGHMTSHMIGHIVGHLWGQIKDKFIQDENGLYYNVRLELEQNKRKAYSDSRRNNIKGVNQYNKPTKNKTKKTGHMTYHMENENENENVDINEVKKFNFKKSLIELGIDENLVTDWLIVRKNKKASNTETAFKSIKNQIEKSNRTANECIELAITKNWSGFESEWIINNKNSYNGTNQRNNQTGGKLASNYRAAEELAAEIREKSKRFEERMQNT